MGLYCKINLDSDWGFPNRTPRLGLPIDYTEAIQVFSDVFMEVSQEMVPVDTGFLKSSLNSSGGGMIMEAEATADYAQYVEYGTWCCPAQPYFIPAVEAASDVAFGVAKRIYNEAINTEKRIMMQQYMNEAQNKIVAAGRAMGAESVIGGLFSLFFMIVVGGIILLFREFFTDLFGPDFNGENYTIEED